MSKRGRLSKNELVHVRENLGKTPEDLAKELDRSVDAITKAVNELKALIEREAEEDKIAAKRISEMDLENNKEDLHVVEINSDVVDEVESVTEGGVGE